MLIAAVNHTTFGAKTPHKLVSIHSS